MTSYILFFKHKRTHTRTRTHITCIHTHAQEDSSTRCSLYMQYALLAAREALSDAGWSEPAAQLSPEQRMGVAIGSGMSSCGEVIEAWHLLVGL